MGGVDPPLGECGNTMDAGQESIDGFPSGLHCTLIASIMDVAELLDSQVPPPPIGDHPRTWGDAVGDEGAQRVGSRVWDNPHAGPTEPSARVVFNGEDDEELLAGGAPAGQSLLVTTEVGLIDFHGPGEEFPAWTHQGRADPVEHRPGRLVGTDLQVALQGES